MSDIGEQIRREIGRELAVESTGWAPELCARVADRLQEGVPEEHRYVPVVVWMGQHGAYALPGRYIYISRALLDRPLMTESAVAFALAHEMAHGDLGHTLSPSLPMAIALAYALARRALYSKKMESDADAHGFVRCLAAGYEGRACLQVFDVLANVQLDYGDVEGTLGESEPRASHPSIAERRETLVARFPRATR